ncbi:MAG: hypothetical protein HBSIN02_07290 [Bacteroidia bacterium]|nr:MAG: hypothetical protein HBSIN02_07290 [Bacteroidia bacterium]
MAELPHEASTDSPSARRKHSSGRPTVRKRLVLSFVVFLSAVIAIILATRGRGGAESEIVEEGRVHTIQLDVFNATGEAKLAQRMTDYLRSRGFDVVEIGNYREPLERTMVIDRSGNSRAAVQVAEALGVPMEQVLQRIDKTLYLDVSVFIGKDYETLRPFR